MAIENSSQSKAPNVVRQADVRTSTTQNQEQVEQTQSQASNGLQMSQIHAATANGEARSLLGATQNRSSGIAEGAGSDDASPLQPLQLEQLLRSASDEDRNAFFDSVKSHVQNLEALDSDQTQASELNTALNAAAQASYGEANSANSASPVTQIRNIEDGADNTPIMQDLAHRLEEARARLTEMAINSQTLNEWRSEIRGAISGMRDELADPSWTEGTRNFEWLDNQGQPQSGALTQQGVRDKIEELEGHLDTIGEDHQMQTFQLQQLVQSEQQIYQTMSNISKTVHETAKTMVNNLKA